MAFPTLTAKARSCPQDFVDNSIKSPADAGYVLARPRFTRTLRKWGPIQLICTETDKGTFETFYLTVGTSTIFDWTHPLTDVVYQVRFSNPPKIGVMPDTNPANRFYSIEYSVDQV